jgi:replicative DNA helicase
MMVGATTVPHIETHCLLLLEFYIRRRLISAMQHSLQHAYYEQKDVMELLAELQKTINDLNAALQLTKPKYVHELLLAVLTGIIKATDGPQGITGVPSGLRVLDNVTGGWQKSDLIIIAARPGMGKTSLVLALAKNAARAGKRGAVFTLEMNSAQLTLKMVASEAGYTTNQLRRGLFDGGLAEAYSLNEKAESLRTLGIIIDDTTKLTIGALRAKATQLKAEEGIEWLAVDYLQFMAVGQKGHSREQEISAISRGLKRLAKELDIQ